MENATQELRANDTADRAILAALQQRIGTQKFNTWFRRGTRVSLEDGHAKVAVPNLFVANWIETHYVGDIAAAAGAELGGEAKVVITVDPALCGRLGRHQLDAQAQQVNYAAEGRDRRPAPAAALRHSLSDFVVGRSNMLAYQAAVAMASGAPSPFSHLVLHGTCGVGKTHLLQGICNSFACPARAGAAGRDGDAKGRPTPPRQGGAWRFVTGEQFTNEFVQAIRKKATAEFRARYRKLDLLAIDDVHFLAGKKATQDEFLHTFNAIQSAGKRIILASDAHPRMVGELNEQLVSRFLSGMVVKIEAPDYALRLELLRRKTAAMNFQAPPEVFEFVATHVRGSVRELEGALLKLVAVAALAGGGITLPMANEALADALARTDSAITLGDIEAAVGAFFGLTPADMHSSRRTQTVSVARMVAMFLARRHTTMSFPEIGRYMGKNHSSVVLAVQRMTQLLSVGGNAQWQTPMGSKSLPAAKVVELLTEQFA